MAPSYYCEAQLFKEIVVVAAIVDLLIHELLGRQQSGIGHPLIGLGYLDLLFVLVDFLEAIGMAGKLLQFVVQLLFQGDVDLVSPFRDNGNRLVQIPGLRLDIGKVLGFHYIGSVCINLPS